MIDFFNPLEIAYDAITGFPTTLNKFPVYVKYFNWPFSRKGLTIAGTTKIRELQASQYFLPYRKLSRPSILQIVDQYQRASSFSPQNPSHNFYAKRHNLIYPICFK